MRHETKAKFPPRACLALLALMTASSAMCQPAELGPALAALAAAQIPDEAKASIKSRVDAEPEAFRSLLAETLAGRSADPMLLQRVDKARALPKGYAPSDLTRLDGTGLSVSRSGHRLRAPAYRALKAMDQAARSAGITLLVSSTYRSYEYQVEVWDRTVAADGEAEAQASVAPPGESQHQLGTAVDFGSITDAFAGTKAGRWLAANAARFGFSLSYPKGMSKITGYKWESWHYRYIGKAAAELQERYFGGVQQYLLLFLEEMK
jgi:zinc D-Ala-D-Ala carboxypeptidase